MEHTAVMLMLCVSIPRDPITARAKMDLLEIAILALVTLIIFSVLIYKDI